MPVTITKPAGWLGHPYGSRRAEPARPLLGDGRAIKRKLRDNNEVVLRPVHPNAGIQAAYRAALDDLIEQMHQDFLRMLGIAYKRNEPAMAQDEEARQLGAVGTSGHLHAAPLSFDATPFDTPLTGAQEQLLQDLAAGANLTEAQARELEVRGLVKRSKATTKAGKAIFELSAAGEAIAASLLSPADKLSAAVRQLGLKWQERFNAAAPKLAEYFATAVEERSQRVLKKILKDGGISVRFRPSKAQTDVLQASIYENVSLIRSIPQQYLTDVEGLVMRSVMAGRDLGTLSKALVSRYGITKRRAALIARDQNNKATSAMTRARQKDLGIKYAIWMHSGAGKEPRPKHVAANGKRYDVSKGLQIGDKGQWVFPGEEISCRCTSRSIIPGFGA